MTKDDARLLFLAAAAFVISGGLAADMGAMWIAVSIWLVSFGCFVGGCIVDGGGYDEG